VYALALDPNWQMSIFVVLGVVLLGFLMKLAALFIPNNSQQTRWPFLLSPLPSPNSIGRVRPAALAMQLRRALLFGVIVTSYYWIYWQVVRRFELKGIVLSYLAAPALWLVGEVVSALVPLPWNGRVPPALHNPPLASSVADFWGRRWNLWFNDWFRYTIFQPLRRKPILALILVFFVSGIMHELVVNVPLFFVTGGVLFGSMMLYFLLQPIGILVERRFTRSNSPAKILFTWLVVLGPAPLILNEGLLRALHLWPG
jgi:membrane bound O-acyltransferase family protein